MGRTEELQSRTRRSFLTALHFFVVIVLCQRSTLQSVFLNIISESVLVTRIGPMALGMPSSLLDIAVVRMPSWYEASPNDVFCLVKAFVSDNELSQPPLLVLPGSQKQNLYDSLCRLALPTAECASPQLHDVPRLCDLKLIHLDV